MELLLIEFQKIIAIGGLTLIVAAIFIETGLLIGMVIPGGESLLFSAGMLCGTKVLDVKLSILLISVCLAAFAGDLTGYTIGKKLGREAFKKRKGILKPENIERAENFYRKHGLAALFIGRYLPFIRTFNPFISGITGIGFKKYFFISGLAASIYVISVILTGYYVGRVFPEIIPYLGIAVPFILLVILFPLLRIIYKEFKSH